MMPSSGTCLTHCFPSFSLKGTLSPVVNAVPATWIFEKSSAPSHSGFSIYDTDSSLSNVLVTPGNDDFYYKIPWKLFRALFQTKTLCLSTCPDVYL